MDPFNLLWLQGASCGGCTMAALDRGQHGWFAELQSFGVHLLWHPSFSEATAAETIALLEAIEAGQVPLHGLVLEGAVLRGPHGSGRFQMLSGTGRSMQDWVTRLALRGGRQLRGLWRRGHRGRQSH